MVSIVARPAAGVGAQAQIQADDTGLRGRLRLLTGASGLAAGPLVLVTLDVQPVADMDAYVATQSAAYPGITSAASFASPDIGLTPWTAPPAGCAFQVVAQLQNGLLAQFAVASTTALAATTEYRFGWRVTL
jgi:hypothetical protein